MNHFETSTVVGGHGEIHLVGVPFTPGTTVEVTVCEKSEKETKDSTEQIDQSAVRVSELFSQVRGRNVESVGPLNREQIYDREVLR